MSTVRSGEFVAVCTRCGKEQTLGEQAGTCARCREPIWREYPSVTKTGFQGEAADVRGIGADVASRRADRGFGRLTVALQWIFAVWVVMAGVGMAFRALERSLLNRAIENRFSVSPAEALASDHRVDTLGYVMIGAFVVTALIFVVWFHQAYRRARAVGGEMRYSNGWAIGGWFIPIASFWIPCKLANDIWWGSGPPKERSWRERSALVISWWLALAFAVLTARFIGASDVDTLDDGLRSNLGAILFLGFVLLAATFALFVVRQIGQRLAARMATVAALLATDAQPSTIAASPGTGREPASTVFSKRRRQPWLHVGATVGVVAIAVGTVVVISGTSGGEAHRAAKPLSTAPQVVRGPAPADFDRHESHSDGFAISVPSSWTSIDLTAADLDATLQQLRLTNPNITDYLDQQEQTNTRPSFYAMDTSVAGQDQVLPPQLNIQRIPTEGQSLNESARQIEQVLSASSDLVGTVDRKRIDLPAGTAQVLSFKFRVATPAGDAIGARTMYALVSGESAYVIVFGGTEDRAQANTPTFEAIIRSLELTN
jgi:Domain of unknown function (DUF4328)